MSQTTANIIAKLASEHNLSDAELLALLTGTEEGINEQLACAADKLRRQYYGDKVYIRGLIEFTNYCKNNCYYCGIRAGNSLAERYRLSQEEILACCAEGYKLGFRTFVLQGGEDLYYTDDKICSLVSAIRRQHPDCAITLSIGEKSRASYQAYFDAGANRYLLRHETADAEHYAKLHPASMSLENRKRCLFDLKEIGYQVGSGFMVGSPYQTPQTLLRDLRFLQKLQPDMIGIGPYITHEHTPFKNQRHTRADAAPAVYAAPAFPLRPAAVDNRPRHNSSGGTRARAEGRRQRRHAQPFTCRRAQEIRALCQQNLHRRGGCPMPRLP